jgi:hypothetical protein
VRTLTSSVDRSLNYPCSQEDPDRAYSGIAWLCCTRGDKYLTSTSRQPGRSGGSKERMQLLDYSSSYQTNCRPEAYRIRLLYSYLPGLPLTGIILHERTMEFFFFTSNDVLILICKIPPLLRVNSIYRLTWASLCVLCMSIKVVSAVKDATEICSMRRCHSAERRLSFGLAQRR